MSSIRSLFSAILLTLSLPLAASAQNIDAWADTDFSKQLPDSILIQRTAQFLKQLSEAPQNIAEKSITELLSNASANPYNLENISFVAYATLIPNTSELHNDLLLSIWTEAELALPQTDEAKKIRLQVLTDNLNKNKIGTSASDFNITLSDGTTATLHSICQNSQLPIIILFYDPECDKCQKAIEEFRQDTQLNQAIKENKIRFLAICTTFEPELWEEISPTLPDNWINGTDNAAIDEQDLYYHDIPSLYLLTPDATILKRNQPATLTSLHTLLFL